MYKPTWVDEFKQRNPDPREMNAKKERLAVDVMIDVKEQELKTSQKAIKYEEDRKREWKEYRLEKKREEFNKQLKIENAKTFAEKFLANRLKKRERDNLRRKQLHSKNN